MIRIPDTFEMIDYAAQGLVNPVLFIVAGAIMVAARPRWHGCWWILFGAILSAFSIAIPMLGVPFGESDEWFWQVILVTKAVGFVATGIGGILVALRLRATGP